LPHLSPHWTRLRCPSHHRSALATQSLLDLLLDGLEDVPLDRDAPLRPRQSQPTAQGRLDVHADPQPLGRRYNRPCHAYPPGVRRNVARWLHGVKDTKSQPHGSAAPRIVTATEGVPACTAASSVHPAV